MTSFRRPEPPSTWRPTPNHPEDFFTAHELERARAYQRPVRLARWLRIVCSLVLTAAFVLADVGGRVSDALGWYGWIAQLLVVFVCLELVVAITDIPIDAWMDLGHDQRWGLSNQTPSTFAVDQVKSFVLGLGLGAVALVPLYALMRWTPWWWLIGAALMTALSVVFGFLFPVVIAPIFNRFEPLTDIDLAERLTAVADASGVSIAGVLVADESRRSSRDNAYVSGLGATRRVVLFDTILDHPRELIEQVVAHELGHWRRHHLRQQVPVMAATSLLVFAVLRAFAGWRSLFEWLGLTGIGDPRALPLVLLVVSLAAGATGLLTAWLSRAHEREADLDALEVLRRPDRVVEMLRRLHVKNVADLQPGRLQRWRSSHPPAAERMAFARSWERSRAERGAIESFTSM